MASIRSRLVIGLIKNRHLLHFKPRPEVVGADFSVEAFRARIDQTTSHIKTPRGVTVENVDLNGLAGEWIVPEQATEGKVLLYIHGGGFISGSCQTHRMHVAKFALGSGLRTLLFDYRLAPEHPFPAALDDCLAAYRWLLDQGYDGDDIAVGGESAGGSLTLSLLLALKDRGIESPKAAFAISPVADLTCAAESFRYNADKDIAPQGSWTVWTNMYIADNDPTQPLLSPLYGDFRGLPPLHICVGTHEIHLDDCRKTAERAEAAGVETTLSQWPGMVHAFPIMAPLFPEAIRALAEICQFVQSHLEE